MEGKQLATGFVFILVCVAVPSAVSGISCFQCNSWKDKDCPNIQLNETNSQYYKLCNDTPVGHEPFCRKIVQTILERDNMVRVVRKCGWEKHPRLDCYKYSDDDHIEEVCQCFEDGCNSASNSRLTLVTLLLSFVAISIVHTLSNSNHCL